MAEQLPELHEDVVAAHERRGRLAAVCSTTKATVNAQVGLFDLDLAVGSTLVEDALDRRRVSFEDRAIELTLEGRDGDGNDNLSLRDDVRNLSRSRERGTYQRRKVENEILGSPHEVRLEELSDLLDLLRS